jgi:hypothetical protein
MARHRQQEVCLVPAAAACRCLSLLTQTVAVRVRLRGQSITSKLSATPLTAAERKARVRERLKKVLCLPCVSCAPLAAAHGLRPCLLAGGWAGGAGKDPGRGAGAAGHNITMIDCIGCSRCSEFIDACWCITCSPTRLHDEECKASRKSRENGITNMQGIVTVLFSG